ncbi:MAG: glycosyltransferase, partial [Bacteroidetes bacterium]|nr:glycosyltransferase [Bacteroidota bacterium]
QVQRVADRVHVLPAVPSEELQQWTASADIGLCMIENLGSSYFLSLPNKLFEYIAAGLPVVGSDFPEIGRVLRESGSGVAVAPEAGLVAEAVHTLIDEPAALQRLHENSRAAAAVYHWDREKPAFQEILAEILTSV